MKRTAALLLAALLLASVTACGESTGEEKESTNTITITDTAGSETEAPAPTAYLPKVDLGGADFRILAAVGEWESYYISEETGDVLNDAVYNLNKDVEELCNLHLDYQVYPGYSAGMTDVRNALSESVMSGSGDFDLLTGSVSYVTVLMDGNLLADLNTIDPIDFSHPWWTEYVNRELSLFGRQYLASGYYGQQAIGMAVVMFYNKAVAAKYDVGDLYQTVFDGKWTLDEVKRLSALTTSDLDGDGTIGEEDSIGLLTTFDYLAMGPSSMGYSFTSRDADGRVLINPENEKIVSIAENLYGFLKSDSVLDLQTQTKKYPTPQDAYAGMRSVFASDRSLLLLHRLNFADSDEFRSMSDFGVLPMFKYDEAQKEYFTPVVIDSTGIPFVVKDETVSAVVLEALQCLSYENVRPVYFDKVLKDKYSRDEESRVMLDLIFKAPVTDFVYAFNRITGENLLLATVQEQNYTTWLQKKLTKIQKNVDNFVDTVKAREE